MKKLVISLCGSLLLQGAIVIELAKKVYNKFFLYRKTISGLEKIREIDLTKSDLTYINIVASSTDLGERPSDDEFYSILYEKQEQSGTKGYNCGIITAETADVNSEYDNETIHVTSRWDPLLVEVVETYNKTHEIGDLTVTVTEIPGNKFKIIQGEPNEILLYPEMMDQEWTIIPETN